MQLTISINIIFKKCSPDFKYEANLNPRRVLTHPSKPVYNDGYDNEDNNYILYVNDIIGEENKYCNIF